MTVEHIVGIRIIDLPPFQPLMVALSHWVTWVAEREDHGAVLNEFETEVYEALTAFLVESALPTSHVLNEDVR